MCGRYCHMICVIAVAIVNLCDIIVVATVNCGYQNLEFWGYCYSNKICGYYDYKLCDHYHDCESYKFDYSNGMWRHCYELCEHYH